MAHGSSKQFSHYTAKFNGRTDGGKVFGSLIKDKAGKLHRFPGTTKLKRLDENIGAAEDLQDIDVAAAKIKVEGDRYPERLEKMTGL